MNIKTSLLILMILISCKTISSEINLLKEAQKGLYSQAYKKRKHKKMSALIYNINKYMYYNEKKPTEQVYFIHTHAFFHSHVNMRSIIIYNDSVGVYYTNMMNGGIEKMNDGHKLFSEEMIVKCLKENRKKDLFSIAELQHNKIDHEGIIYISLLDFTQKKIIESIIISEFFDPKIFEKE